MDRAKAYKVFGGRVGLGGGGVDLMACCFGHAKGCKGSSRSHSGPGGPRGMTCCDLSPDVLLRVSEVCSCCIDKGV